MKWMRLISWLGVAGVVVSSVVIGVCCIQGHETAVALRRYSTIFLCESAGLLLLAMIMRAIVCAARPASWAASAACGPGPDK